MTEPGLGSGALWEALDKVVEEYFGEDWRPDLTDDLLRAALSLSSPIEPCEHDKTDLGHVHTIAEQASSEIREAQTFEQWWQAEGVHMVRTTHRTGYELMKEAWNAALAPSRQGAGGK